MIGNNDIGESSSTYFAGQLKVVPHLQQLCFGDLFI